MAEVSLRLSHYGEGQIQLAHFMQHDPLLGWRHIPHLTGEWHSREFDVGVHYNAQGWRDSDHTYHKPTLTNTSRIAILGDSFVEGYGVAAKDRFSEVLQAIIGVRFEVINLGVSGYSTDQELLVLENEGWKFEPDIVVLELYYNDIWDNGRSDDGMGTQKPMFVVDGAGALRLTNVPVPPPARRTVRPRSRLYELLRSIYRQRLARRKAVQPKALPTASAEVPDIPKRASSPRSPGSEAFDVYLKTESPRLRNSWSVTQALLHRMKEETDQHHARLLILYVPMTFELSEEKWRRWFSSDSAPGQVAAKITSICQAEGIEYIEPSERFREAGRRERLYYETDPHWTAAGHQLAGRILAEYIQDSRHRVVR